MSTALVMTHRVVADTARAIEPLIAEARAAGFQLLFDPEETSKHDLAAHEGVVLNADEGLSSGVDLCIVLGGDGTILRALRRFGDTGVPVFAINFGEVGFLATVEPDDLREGFRRAFARDFEVLRLPAVMLDGLDGEKAAINDVSIHRKVGERVAQLAYAIGDAELGSVRCDGLVIATPAGSTGYNLANAGPVMAWGVEGFAVSFIAPHSLTARALVVSPTDTLTVHNHGRDVVDVIVDGRPIGELPPGDAVTATFRNDVASLAQVAGTSFYQRLREKFGRLSQ